jgi:hypothetical protein
MAITGKPAQNPAYRPSGSFVSIGTLHHQSKTIHHVRLPVPFGRGLIPAANIPK